MGWRSESILRLQKGVVLLLSEVVIFVLLLQGAFMLQSRGVSMTAEVEWAGEVKDLELLSYNILLDLCQNLKNWAVNLTDSGDAQQFIPKLMAWEDSIRNYVEEGGTISLEISFDGPRIEGYHGQELDRFQMGHIGTSGSARWHISGVLYVKTTESWITRSSIYRISIAV